MARTLVALAEPTSPPTVAQRNGIAADMAALDGLGSASLKAIQIVCLIIVNNAAGDTNYTNNHTQLISDANVMFGGISIIDDTDASYNLKLIQTVLVWALAKDTVAATTGDVDTLLNTGRDFRTLPEETLNRIILFLQYMMSV